MCMCIYSVGINVMQETDLVVVSTFYLKEKRRVAGLVLNLSKFEKGGTLLFGSSI